MCTGIRLKANNGAIIYARTLEFGRDIGSQIIMIPRNYSFVGTAPSGKSEGLQWQSRYAVVGANACNIIGIVDGVNEEGLAGGLFYFSGYAQYQKVAPKQIKHSLASWELMTWILTTCATVAQVEAALPTINVSNATFGPWGITPPIHAIVHDPTGACLVIEYIDGQLMLHHNPLGVFTNAPHFDWHMTNIKNYVNLSPFNSEKKSFDGTIFFEPLGQGSGMLGLPGDFTSPSRFIRALAFSHSTAPLATEDEARHAAFHILDLFDIPQGVVRDKEGNQTVYDYTQWTSAADLHNRRYYFHTYNNRNVYMIDLKKMSTNQTKPITIPMQAKETIVDITPHN